MESKHKNALIGALLAVVFVMAVGYAAFAQQLTINGTAEITSTWDIHFRESEVSKSNGITVSCTNGLSSGTTCGTDSTDAVNPSMEVNRKSDTEMEFNAYLLQPGDVVTATVHPHNYGSLCATGTMTVSDTDKTGYTGGTLSANHTATTEPVTMTKDHVKITITPSFAPRLQNKDAGSGNEDSIVIKAEYLETTTTNEAIPSTKAGVSVSLDYSQVACTSQP